MKQRTANPLSYLVKAFIYGWALFILFVLAWIVVSSLKTNQNLFTHIWSLPSTFQIQNYVNAWQNAGLQGYFLNSVYVVGVSVIGIVLFSAPAAYVLSRIQFKGKEFLTNTFVIGIGIPYQIVLLPLFMMLNQIGLYDSLNGLIVVYIALSLPFSIYLLTGFFQSIPYELEEAAAIDGASANRTFWEIILPISRSGIVTVVILNSVGLWNEFLLALTFISDDKKYTLSRGLFAFNQTMQYNADWVSLFAGVVIVIVPILVAYVWLSDRIIEGMTMGSGK